MAVVESLKVEGADEAVADINKVQKSLEKFNKGVQKNRDATRLLDKATGGAVTKFQDLQKGLSQGIIGVKGLATSFKGLKGAIAATGIGLIVVALGTIVAYWDEIKILVSGVSLEQDRLLKSQKEYTTQTEDAFNNISASANILKQQGVTEKEILDLKIKSTDESITALEAQLTTQKAIQETQIETAKRNKDLLEGALKLVSLPLFVLLETLDSIGKALGKNLGLTEGLYGSIGDLVFDPEGVKEKGEESIKETEKQLLALKNRKAGFEINITKIEQQEFEKRQAAKQAQYKIEFDAYKKHLEEMTQLTIDDLERLGKIRSDYNAKIDEQAVIDEQTKLDLDRERALREIDELKINDGLKGNARLAVNTFFDNQQLALNKKFDDEDTANKLAKFESDKQIEMMKMDLLGNFGGFLQQIAGENKTLAIGGVIASQAAAVGNIISQTGIANAKAVAAFPITLGQPFVGLNTASAGISIASTIAAAAQSISKIKSSGSAASTMNANVPSPTGGGAAPPPAFNIVGQTETSQLSETIASQTQEPVQAFVVANDVTTAQSLQRNIVQGATI
tara:strand:- start:9859 stop:11556 length:1698 start_codon:yes stop_codon:yes gene_type:complete